ncbi:MAG: hypothetical protein WDZ79_02750 [Candidatus Paceibacterota bacterium]
MKMLMVVLMVAFFLLPGCATAQPMPDDGENRVMRTFFGGFHFYGSYETELAMLQLEDTLEEIAPDEFREEDGRVKEKYLAGLYASAAQDDQHVSSSELALYRDGSASSIRGFLPNTLGMLRRHRER